MSEYARLVIAVDSAQVRQADQDLARLERQSSSTESAVVGMAGKIAAAFAGIKLADHISNVVQLASRYDQMGLVMETVGRNTGRSTVELAALDQALQETGISALQSRNNIIRMMSANIDLAQATNLARLAQDAAVIANTNSSEAFERLIRGIQSAEKETLETMGLNVNFAQSYEKLAAQLGKKADQLTVVEKVQAGVNAALEAGTNIAGAYDASMENAGKQLGSTARHLENLQIALGKTWQPQFTAGVEAYSGALKFLNNNVEAVAQVIETGLYVAIGLATTAVGRKTAATISDTLASRAQAAQELQLAQAQAASTGSTLAKLQATFKLTGATTGLTAATAAHEAALKRQAVAQAASVGAGRALLGIMGGPAGLAVTASAVALSFVDWGYSAEEAALKSIALREETNLLTRAVQELDAAQAQQVLQKMEEPYKAAKDEARKYAAQIEYLTMQLDQHPGSAKVDEWNRSLVDARGNLSTVNQSIAEQEEKMRQLNARINENTQAREENNNALGETDDAGKKWLASLQQRADFSGKLTEVQRVSIAIEKGYAGTLSDTDKAMALANAAIIDRNNAIKSSVKPIKDIDSAYRSLYDSLFPAEAAQRKYNEQVALLKKHLQGDALAKAIDRLNDSMADGDHTGPADAIKAYREELDRLEDKINPAGRAAREFREEQAKLRAEIERSGDPTGKWTRLLEENERQMRENTRVTNQWTEWTESALERVDSAFADAWRNIGDGFGSFRDNLVNAFKQMLAELAHLAITRPIVLQIGAAMGIGGMSGTAMAGIGGGGGGGMDIVSLARMGYQAYQGVTGQGLIGSIVSGFQTGGLSGAWGGATGWAGGAASGLNAAAGQIYGVATQGGAGLTTYAPLTYQMGGVSNTVAGIAPWASGLGGAYMGYQQAGVKGAIAGGLGGWGGAKAGAALGSLAGPIGTAVGAVVGGILGSIGGAKLFGSGERFKRTVGSATGYYGGEGYVSTGPSATWHPGSRKFGAEHDAVLDDLNNAFVTTIGSLFDAFDVDSTIATTARTRLRRTSGRMVGDFITEIDGQITKFYRQYSKDGKLGEAMEQYADDIMGEYLAKTIVGSDLPEYFRQQFEQLAADSKVTAEQVAETLTGIFARFDGVNHVLELTRLAAFELTDAGMRASDALIALSGGLEALQAGAATYYDQFFTAAEKQADTISAVEKAFEAANITLAESREGYRAMVEEIDVTTEAGQQMFATMMSLSGMAAEYYSILERQAAEELAQAEAHAAALLTNLQTYYDRFTTESQKVEDTLAGVAAQFAALELALPGTRDGFIAAVDALDTSTEAGQRMFETLIGLAGAADTYYSILEDRAATAAAEAARLAQQQAEEAERIARESVSSSLALLERSIQAEKDALTAAYAEQKTARESALKQQQEYEQGRAASYRDMAETAAATASALNRLGGSISSTLSGLLDEVPGALEQRRSLAVAQIRRALETGNLSDTDALAEAAQRAAAVDSGVFTTLEDYRREQGRTANLLGELGELTTARQSAAERQAESLQALAEQSAATAQALGQSISGVKSSIDIAYEAEMAALDEQLELAKSQVDALNGIDKSVVSVADAVAGLGAAIRDAMSIIPGLSGIEIPAFASGGVHTGGLRLVGERGPELEVTGPSRIYTADQTARMLGGGAETAAAISRLEQTVARQGDALRAIAKHTMKSARNTEVLERWDYDGLPEERAIA